MLERLREVGVDLTEDDVRRVAVGTPATGRPHVADALVARGVVASRAEAFDRYLNPGRPGYARRFAADLDDVVPLVVAAGGVPVVAHPWGRTRAGRADRRCLRPAQGIGLAGIEVDHQDHDPAARERSARSLETSTSSSPGPATTTARARSTTTSAATPPHPRSWRGSASSPTPPAPRGWRGERAHRHHAADQCVRHALRDHGSRRHRADLPVADRRPLQGQRAPGGLAGRRGLVRGDHGVRVLRPADPGLPAHLAARPAVRGRPAAPARRPRAADRQREGADPPGRHQRRARPARHPAARRPRRDRRDDALLQRASTTSPTSPPSRWPSYSSTCASGPRCATPCRSSG